MSQHPRPKQTPGFDVIVVGAGIVGVSAAYRMATRGARVGLVDAHLDGRATAAGAGIVTPIAVGVDPADGASNTLVAAAIDHYETQLLPALADDGNSDTGYARVGLLFIDPAGRDPAALDDLERRARVVAAVGSVPPLTVERTTASDAWPELATGRVDTVDAVHIPAAARIDGRLLRAAIEGAAVRRGARLIDGTARLSSTAGRCTVGVGGQSLLADQVLLATGAWSGGLLAPFGLAGAARPVRGQILHLQVVMPAPEADRCCRPWRATTCSGSPAGT